MATKTKGRFVDGLVDLKSGQISREIFVNEEIYAEEQEQVFTRAWLFIGHESQVPKPGDYFVSGMGEESVILCRDREGALHVFLYPVEAVVDFSQTPDEWHTEIEAWREAGGTHLSLRAMDTTAEFVGFKRVGYTGPGDYIRALETFMKAVS